MLKDDRPRGGYYPRQRRRGRARVHHGRARSDRRTDGNSGAGSTSSTADSPEAAFTARLALFTLVKVSLIMPAMMPVTATLIVLALATLDDETQIGSFLLAKVSK